MDYFERFSQWFWNDSFWLPQNVSWEDIKPTKSNPYANFNDLFYPLPMALAFIIVRKLYERILLQRLGRYFGLKDTKKRKAVDNVILEKAFRINGKIQHKQIQGLAKQLDWSERQVERWFRHRSYQNKPTVLDKFTECGWRFSYYLCIFLYGLYVLWDKPWLWDSRECWNNFPMHFVTNDIWWYYMLTLSFYWSLTISQFMDVKRKDFWEMFIHHWLTISLMSFSWAINMTRIGSLVMILHDLADPILELAKLSKYVNQMFLCNLLFILFAVVWIISRLFYYPYVVLYSTVYEAADIMYNGKYAYEAFPANIVFNTMLCMLQVLHIIWTFFIFRVIITAMSAGKLVKDERSEDSCSMSDSLDNENSEKAM